MKKILRIGTRGSVLALAQAGEVKTLVEKKHPNLSCELVILKTSGDDFTPPPAQNRTGGAAVNVKGLFVKEIEEALLAGKIELAVHSVKDLQAELPEGLTLAAILPREDPRDVLVTRGQEKLNTLKSGAGIGASSLRRQSQLKRIRRDLEIVPIRGNVDTRLKKLDSGECDALILAGCGLKRLGLSQRISEWLEPSRMLPASGQGALGVEIAEGDKEIDRWIQALDDSTAHAEVTAERALVKALGGGCDVPIGAHARVQGANLTLVAAVFSPDGLKTVRKEISGSKEAAERLGKELASHLRAAGADRLLYGNWVKTQ